MTRSRPRLPAEQRREQLLDACAAIVDTEGFHAATIDRVAAACDVTRTVVYQHFGGHDGMLRALVGRATERAGATLAAARAASRAGRTSLRDAMAAVLHAVDADPATWRMFLVAPGAGPPELAESLARGRAMIRDHNLAAIGADRNRPDDPELAARLLQAVADELVRLRLADPAAYTIDRILAQVEAVGEGLLHRHGPTGDGTRARPRPRARLRADPRPRRS